MCVRDRERKGQKEREGKRNVRTCVRMNERRRTCERTFTCLKGKSRKGERKRLCFSAQKKERVSDRESSE